MLPLAAFFLIILYRKKYISLHYYFIDIAADASYLYCSLHVL